MIVDTEIDNEQFTDEAILELGDTDTDIPDIPSSESSDLTIPITANRVPYDCKKIADLSGISYTHVLNVLSGKSKAGLNTAKKISEAMNLSLEEFYDIVKSLHPGTYSGGRELDDEKIKLIKSDKGQMTCRVAAKKYGVSRETISRVWKSEPEKDITNG